MFTVDAPLAPEFQVDLGGDGYEYAGGDGDSDSDSEISGDENEFRAFSPSPVTTAPSTVALVPSLDLKMKMRLTAQQSPFPTISSISLLLMTKNYHVQKEYRFGMTLRTRWQRLTSVRRDG